MSEIVERVATAIAEAEGKWDSSAKMDSGWAWDNPERGRVLFLARAAIAAMREPTQVMLQVAGEDWYEAETSWETMIDAALK